MTVGDEKEIIASNDTECRLVEILEIRCQDPAAVDRKPILAQLQRRDPVRANTVLNNNKLIAIAIQAVDAEVSNAGGNA